MAKRKPATLVQAKIRMRESLRARLQETAERRGSTITAEIVDRLERSFDRQDLLPEVLTTALGSKEVAGLVMLLAAVVQRSGGLCRQMGRRPEALAESESESAWIADPYAFDQAVQAVLTVLEAVRPAGDTKTPAGLKGLMPLDKVPDLTFEGLGADFAVSTMTDVRANPPKTEVARQIRHLLGSIAERLPDYSVIPTPNLVRTEKILFRTLKSTPAGREIIRKHYCEAFDLPEEASWEQISEAIKKLKPPEVSHELSAQKRKKEPKP